MSAALSPRRTPNQEVVYWPRARADLVGRGGGASDDPACPREGAWRARRRVTGHREAGISKSGMLDEAARLAAGNGLKALTGREVEGGGTYRPIAEALVQYLRDIDVIQASELRSCSSALHRTVPGWAGLDVDREPATAVDPVLVHGEGIVRLLRCVLVSTTGHPRCRDGRRHRAVPRVHQRPHRRAAHRRWLHRRSAIRRPRRRTVRGRRRPAPGGRRRG
jgi:hypothetical protein